MPYPLSYTTGAGKGLPWQSDSSVLPGLEGWVMVSHFLSDRKSEIFLTVQASANIQKTQVSRRLV